MVIYTHYKESVFKVVFISTLLLIDTLQSCRPKETEPISPYSYFPTVVGQYSIYEITEVVYAAGKKDSVMSIWQEKDEISSVLRNSAGIPTYIISTSTKNKSSGNWQKIKQYTLEMYPDKIIKNLDNESIVPMVFPIDKTLKWDGYMYLNLNSKDNRYGHTFYYDNVEGPFNNGFKNFENTLKVVERIDTSGLTKYNFASKHYAYGVGLILDQQADFEYSQVNGELSGYKVISSGIRRIKKLIESSKN